jgi:hypothetical protein
VGIHWVPALLLLLRVPALLLLLRVPRVLEMERPVVVAEEHLVSAASHSNGVNQVRLVRQ